MHVLSANNNRSCKRTWYHRSTTCVSRIKSVSLTLYMCVSCQVSLFNTLHVCLVTYRTPSSFEQTRVSLFRNVTRGVRNPLFGLCTYSLALFTAATHSTAPPVSECCPFMRVTYMLYLNNIRTTKSVNSIA